MEFSSQTPSLNKQSNLDKQRSTDNLSIDFHHVKNTNCILLIKTL